MGAPKPPLIPEPFAQNAADITNPIPQTTGVSGAASYDQGFPAVTMQPVAAGGKPPLGQDFNGILFALSSHDYYVQAGQLFQFDVDVRDAIGGYALGTILGSVDGKTIWVSVVASNMSDPDTTVAFGWVAAFHNGYTTKGALTGGTISITPQEAAAPVIILNGTLTSNLTVLIPELLRSWLIVNNTTGLFTTTVRALGGGTGVAVPQGGFSNPLGVYSNGTNFYPTVAPLGVPISQAADPLTLVQRTNAGIVFANLFNSTAVVANPTIANVITDSGNGFFQKNTLANFEAQMELGNIGGAVISTQVPEIAVTQYAAAILDNAALTGVPTAPTAAVGTSNAQVASTGFVNPFSLLANPGAFRLPSGHLVCYGTANPNGGTVTVTLPGGLSYSSAASYVVIPNGTSHPTTCNAVILNSSQFALSNSGGGAYWITVGF